MIAANTRLFSTLSTLPVLWPDFSSFRPPPTPSPIRRPSLVRPPSPTTPRNTPASAEKSPSPTCPSPEKPSPSTTVPPSSRAQKVHGPRPPQASRSNSTPKGFKEPRLMRTAPNGDIFLADSHGDKIWVLRGVGADGKAKTISTFASGLDLPFGIAFYPSGPNPQWVYVGNTKTVVRFPYKSGDLVATGPARDHRRRTSRLRPATRRRPLDSRRRLHPRRHAECSSP